MVKYFTSENGYFYKILNNKKIRVSKEEFKKKTKIKGGVIAIPAGGGGGGGVGGGGGGGEQQDNQLKAYQDYVNELYEICKKFLILDILESPTLTTNRIINNKVTLTIQFKSAISSVKQLKINISNPGMRYNLHSQPPNSISYVFQEDTVLYKFTGIDEFIKILLEIILEIITYRAINFHIVLSKTYETNNGYHANCINVENNNDEDSGNKNYNVNDSRMTHYNKNNNHNTKVEYIAMQNILSDILNILSQYCFDYTLVITHINYDGLID